MVQVEDMLKRSFAEFHAQKAIGSQILKIEKADRILEGLKGKKWPDCRQNCTKLVLRHYYDVHQRLKLLSADLMPLMLSNPKAQRALAPGRVILLFDKESALLEIGVILSESDSPSANTSSKKASAAPSSFIVMHLHTPGPWDVPLISASGKTGLSGEHVRNVMVCVVECDVAQMMISRSAKSSLSLQRHQMKGFSKGSAFLFQSCAL